MEKTPSRESNESAADVQILEAQPADIEQIQDVFYETWRATYPNEEFGITLDDIDDRFKHRHAPNRLAMRRQELMSSHEYRKLFVAKVGDKIIGVCRIEDWGDHCRLGALYVLPEYQEKGVGKRFWQQMQRFSAGKDIYLTVALYNQRAIDFYSRLGFVETGRRFTDERFRMKSGSTIPEMEMVFKTQ